MTRFAVIVSSDYVENWQASLLNKIIDNQHADLAAFIILPTRQERRGIIHNMYHEMMKRYVHSLRTYTISSLFPAVPILLYESLDVQTKIDFCILLDSTSEVPAKLLKSSHKGVWYFQIGMSNTLPGLNESIMRVAGIRVCMRRISNFGDELVHQVYLPLSRHVPFQSIEKVLINIPDIFQKVFTKPWQDRLEQIVHSNRSEYFEEYTGDVLNIFALMTFLLRTLLTKVGFKLLRMFTVDQWNVGVVKEPIQAFLNPEYVPKVDWLPKQARNMLRADPFGTTDANGNVILFYEELDYRDWRGKIVASYPNGQSRSIQIGDSSHHMSYPYLIKENETLYCIPECYQSGGIALYKAVRFPDIWEKVATIVDNFSGVDSTVLKVHGKWWLFVTGEDGSFSHSKLYIWFSDSLEGTWTPHPLNPVKMDVRNSRPAGTPFVYGGKIYRPTQDCSETYGGRVAINEIKELSSERFVEETILYVSPYKNTTYSRGIHHISSVREFTLIDSKRLVFNPVSLFNKFLKRPRHS